MATERWLIEGSSKYFQKADIEITDAKKTRRIPELKSDNQFLGALELMLEKGWSLPILQHIKNRRASNELDDRVLRSDDASLRVVIGWLVEKESEWNNGMTAFFQGKEDISKPVPLRNLGSIRQHHQPQSMHQFAEGCEKALGVLRDVAEGVMGWLQQDACNLKDSADMTLDKTHLQSISQNINAMVSLKNRSQIWLKFIKAWGWMMSKDYFADSRYCEESLGSFLANTTKAVTASVDGCHSHHLLSLTSVPLSPSAVQPLFVMLQPQQQQNFNNLKDLLGSWVLYFANVSFAEAEIGLHHLYATIVYLCLLKSQEQLLPSLSTIGCGALSIRLGRTLWSLDAFMTLPHVASIDSGVLHLVAPSPLYLHPHIFPAIHHRIAIIASTLTSPAPNWLFRYCGLLPLMPEPKTLIDCIATMVCFLACHEYLNALLFARGALRAEPDESFRTAKQQAMLSLVFAAMYHTGAVQMLHRLPLTQDEERILEDLLLQPNGNLQGLENDNAKKILALHRLVGGRYTEAVNVIADIGDMRHKSPLESMWKAFAVTYPSIPRPSSLPQNVNESDIVMSENKRPKLQDEILEKFGCGTPLKKSGIEPTPTPTSTFCRSATPRIDSAHQGLTLGARTSTDGIACTVSPRRLSDRFQETLDIGYPKRSPTAAAGLKTPTPSRSRSRYSSLFASELKLDSPNVGTVAPFQFRQPAQPTRRLQPPKQIDDEVSFRGDLAMSTFSPSAMADTPPSKYALGDIRETPIVTSHSTPLFGYSAKRNPISQINF